MKIDNNPSEKQTIIKWTKRKRLREIANAWHCSIIGTCLSLREVRGLAKKTGIYSNKENGKEKDARFHGHFVREAGKNSSASRLLNKLLDKKFSTTIKRLQKINSVDKLSEAWDDSFASGDIPGPYWAIISHPLTNEELGLSVYSDVHMLSHLVGASNRKDRILLHRLEAEKEKFDSKLKTQRLSQIESLKQKDKCITELRKQILSLQKDLAGTKAVKLKAENQQNFGSDKLGASRHKIKQLSKELVSTKIKLENFKQQNENLNLTLKSHKSEIRSLEDALSDTRIMSVSRNKQFDLSGNRILYVGGRQRLIGRLQTLVSNWNGVLDHHDGGIEQSMKELNQAINKADVVVFPVDCVSHNAANKVKDICNGAMKPFTPLRSTGLGSLILGLQTGLKQFALSAQQNKQV